MKDWRARLEAADILLSESSTTFQKFTKIRTLVSGINPQLDKALNEAYRILNRLQKMDQVQVIELSAEALPDQTLQQKKRKKLLLLFITRWKTLKNEVNRIHKQQNAGNSGNIGLAKTIAFAKGPLGIITIAAVVIVGAIALFKASLVNIVITNRGCDALTPVAKLPVDLPGISLPTQPIPDGGQATAIVPPLTVKVVGDSQAVTMSVLNFNMKYHLPNDKAELLFDGQSLLNRQTTINLGSAKTHQLVIQCNG